MLDFFHAVGDWAALILAWVGVIGGLIYCAALVLQ
jgi:hypothetical protein